MNCEPFTTVCRELTAEEDQAAVETRAERETPPAFMQEQQTAHMLLPHCSANINKCKSCVARLTTFNCLAALQEHILPDSEKLRDLPKVTQ